MKPALVLSLSLVLLSTLASGPVPDNRRGQAPARLLENFEEYQVRGLPVHWRYIDARQRLMPVSSEIMKEDEYFVVLEEAGNKFLRAITKGRAHRLILPNGGQYNWRFGELNRLSWSWRARKLPSGAREDVGRLNDTGGAVYVTFDRDWVGRPRSIKYTYSSTLPVGTTVKFGRLAVVVVSSGRSGAGAWKTVERDVLADYRRFFGGEPPAKPVSIMIWSDSDSTGDQAEVDFDNLMLLP